MDALTDPLNGSNTEQTQQRSRKSCQDCPLRQQFEKMQAKKRGQ